MSTDYYAMFHVMLLGMSLICGSIAASRSGVADFIDNIGEIFGATIVFFVPLEVIYIILKILYS